MQVAQLHHPDVVQCAGVAVHARALVLDEAALGRLLDLDDRQVDLYWREGSWVGPQVWKRPIGDLPPGSQGCVPYADDEVFGSPERMGFWLFSQLSL